MVPEETVQWWNEGVNEGEVGVVVVQLLEWWLCSCWSVGWNEGVKFRARCQILEFHPCFIQCILLLGPSVGALSSPSRCPRQCEVSADSVAKAEGVTGGMHLFHEERGAQRVQSL